MHSEIISDAVTVLRLKADRTDKYKTYHFRFKPTGVWSIENYNSLICKSLYKASILESTKKTTVAVIARLCNNGIIIFTALVIIWRESNYCQQSVAAIN